VLVPEDIQMLQRIAVAASMVVMIACSQSDPGVTTAVKSKLVADDAVRAFQIDVDTRDRVVTLSGTVETAAARERALTIARQTDGVRNVVDHIAVNPQSTVTTGGLKEDAREAGRELREEAREAADAAAKLGREAQSKAGDVADRAGAVLTDAAVTTAVKAKFVADPTVSALKIDVDTRDGVVTLNGRVAGKAEADRAMTLARQSDGVKRVVSNLRVGS
jgi:osmotically-inducible protein OsmY